MQFSTLRRLYTILSCPSRSCCDEGQGAVPHLQKCEEGQLLRSQGVMASLAGLPAWPTLGPAANVFTPGQSGGACSRKVRTGPPDAFELMPGPRPWGSFRACHGGISVVALVLSATSEPTARVYAVSRAVPLLSLFVDAPFSQDGPALMLVAAAWNQPARLQLRLSEK